MRLLVTGASGRMATAMRPLLLDDPDIRLVLAGRSNIATNDPRETSLAFDLVDADATRAAVEAVDAVLHLGGQATEASFDTVLEANIRGTYNVFEAVRRGGLGQRVIFASSYHAMGFHARGDMLDGDSPYRPDTFYGLSKAYGELLARLYWDKFGVESLSVRIGSCFEEPRDRRMLATWLSHADMVRLVHAALNAPVLRAAMVYGVSNNTERWWTNEHARFLGWAPQDSSEAWRARFADAERPERGTALALFQGGAFAECKHPNDD